MEGNKLLEFIKKIKPNIEPIGSSAPLGRTEVEHINKISDNIYLLKYPNMIIVIPVKSEKVTTESFIRNSWERLLCLEELRIKIKPGVIMSHHRPSDWIDIGEISSVVTSKEKVNAQISNGKQNLFVHFIDSDGIINFMNEIGFNKIRVIDHGTNHCIISWITINPNENNPNDQLYNLSSDIIGAGLIIH